MKLKFLFIVFSLVTLLTTISPAFAFDFSYIKSIKYSASNLQFINFVPFDGNGRPTSSPIWFVPSSFAIKPKATNSNGMIIHSQDDDFSQKISVTAIGTLDINGIVRNGVFNLQSNSKADIICSIFTDQRVYCQIDGGSIRITRSGYNWNGQLDYFTYDMIGTDLGFKNIVLIGYKNSQEVLKINIVTDYFKFGYLNAPLQVINFDATSGNVNWINTPTIGVKNSGITFNFNNYTQQKSLVKGQIFKRGGIEGRVELFMGGTLDIGGNIETIRNEVYTYPIETSFSECPIFTSDHIHCIIRFGYIHTYIPSHEDVTLWKTFFNKFVLDIQNGKATVSAGVYSDDDLFKISNMVIGNYKFR